MIAKLVKAGYLQPARRHDYRAQHSMPLLPEPSGLGRMVVSQGADLELTIWTNDRLSSHRPTRIAATNEGHGVASQN